MILAAGLTPAWQHVLVFDHFRPGEVNRAGQSHWCASGKVLNAAVAAHRLGGPVLALVAAGGPHLAQMDRDLAALGVPRRWVVTQSATRVCTTILDQATGQMTELVPDGLPLTPAELDAFAAAYAEEAARADAVVLTGSLPAGAPAATYRRLVEKTPCPAVLDFRGEGLLAVLDLKPFLVKPNRQELALTLGRDLGDDTALQDAMHDLHRRGAQWVLVTQGPGPVWLTSAEHTYRLQPPPVGRPVNPLGSGDALAAAVALAISRGSPMIEAARFGIAAAGANLRQLLPGRLDPAGIETAAAQVRVETL
ncbi:MAG: PfkB family carbohydrate kinase [Thermoguttaceae bacterium]